MTRAWFALLVCMAAVFGAPARAGAGLDFSCVGIERPLHPGLSTGELRFALQAYSEPPGGAGWIERDCVLGAWSDVAFWEWYRASEAHAALRTRTDVDAQEVVRSEQQVEARRAVALANTRDWLAHREAIAHELPDPPPDLDPEEVRARCRQLAGRQSGGRCPGARRGFSGGAEVDARSPVAGAPGVAYVDGNSGAVRIQAQGEDVELWGQSVADASTPILWRQDGTLLVLRGRGGEREIVVVDPKQVRGERVLAKGRLAGPVAVPERTVLFVLSELEPATLILGRPVVPVRTPGPWRWTWFSVDADATSLVGTRLLDGSLVRGDLTPGLGQVHLDNVVVLEDEAVSGATRPAFAASGRVVFFARSPTTDGEWALWEWGYGASTAVLLFDGVALPDRHAPAVSPDGTRVGVCVPGSDMGEGLKIIHLDEGGRVSAVPGSDGCLDPTFSLESGDLVVTWSALPDGRSGPRELRRHVFLQDGLVER